MLPKESDVDIVDPLLPFVVDNGLVQDIDVSLHPIICCGSSAKVAREHG